MMRKNPSVTEMLSPYVDSRWFNAEATERGSAVHRAIASHLRGVWSPPLPPEWQPYLASALRWIDDVVDEAIIIEVRFEDTLRGYNGKPDLICRLRGDSGVISLVDFKTSQATAKWWPVQLAAYRELVHESTGIHIGRILSVRTKADGSGCLVTEYTDKFQIYWNIFTGILNAHNYFNST